MLRLPGRGSKDLPPAKRRCLHLLSERWGADPSRLRSLYRSAAGAGWRPLAAHIADNLLGNNHKIRSDRLCAGSISEVFGPSARALCAIRCSILMHKAITVPLSEKEPD